MFRSVPAKPRRREELMVDEDCWWGFRGKVICRAQMRFRAMGYDCLLLGDLEVAQWNNTFWGLSLFVLTL